MIFTLNKQLEKASIKLFDLPPDKINVGTLGNIVSQLHIHIIARFKTDLAWPQCVWQENVAEKPYEKTNLEKQMNQLRVALS